MCFFGEKKQDLGGAKGDFANKAKWSSNSSGSIPDSPRGAQKCIYCLPPRTWKWVDLLRHRKLFVLSILNGNPSLVSTPLRRAFLYRQFNHVRHLTLLVRQARAASSRSKSQLINVLLHPCTYTLKVLFECLLGDSSQSVARTGPLQRRLHRRSRAVFVSQEMCKRCKQSFRVIRSLLRRRRRSVCFRHTCLSIGFPSILSLGEPRSGSRSHVGATRSDCPRLTLSLIHI